MTSSMVMTDCPFMPPFPLRIITKPKRNVLMIIAGFHLNCEFFGRLDFQDGFNRQAADQQFRFILFIITQFDLIQPFIQF